MTDTRVNIGGDKDDTFYRYKRDKIKVEFEAKNGGQTVITNLSTISKQLKVTPDQIITFFKKNSGLKTVQNKFSGRFDAGMLDKILEKFIKEFVLCKKCGLPELDQGNCLACGQKVGSRISTSSTQNNENTVEDEPDDEPVSSNSNMIVANAIRKLDKICDDALEGKTEYTEDQIVLIKKFIDYLWNDEDDAFPNKKIKKIKKVMAKNNLQIVL